MVVRTPDFWRGKRVLVTGAGGFLGTHLTAALVSAGADVTVILRDDPALSSFRIRGLEHAVNVVTGSISDHALVERTINEYEIDSCFHLAAQALVGAANRAPLSTFESNIKGTWTVLEACRVGSGVERVVVASSDKAYGSQSHLPYTEDMPLLGSNPYDVSKACTDLLATSYHRTYGLPVAVTRCANLYGGGDLNFSRLVPSTIRSGLEGERPVVRSDGTPLRDYIYIDDAVEAYLSVAQELGRDEVAGEAFNFGAGSPVKVIDLVAMILQACQRPDLEPDIQASGPLPLEIQNQYLDSSKAARVLGWTPATDLDRGLAQAVEWYRDYLSQPAA